MELIPQRSAEDAVTETLRNAIRKGTLRPGQKLAQAELAEQLGVSRIPLRDALRRLEVESLVRIDGRRGAWVTVLTPENIAEIYEIRIMLEECCARHAIRNLNDEDMERLIQLLDKMDEDESDEDVMAANRRAFYSELYKGAKRPRMLSMILQLRDNVGRYHFLRDRGHSHRAHSELRESISQRDGKRLAKAIRSHLDDARDDLIQTMSTEEE